MHLTDDARELADDLTRLRHTLHGIPEIGLDLPRTQETVLDALAGLPLDVSQGTGLSSVTAVLRGARPGPTVLLRGDMDALPVTERTGWQHAAEGDRMHACGHDLHTTMLAGAARLLAERRDRLAGNVVLMFQPGEEGYDGAGHMLNEGVLQAAGEQPVAAYALHVMSSDFPRGTFTARPGPMMAASNELQVTVRGAGGHGSSPHRANDPIPAACEMVTALQTWISRSIDVFDPVVLTVGSFHAGTARNIIPDEATFEATVRCFSPEALARLKDGTVTVCRGIAAAHGLNVDVEFTEQYPVTVNDSTEVQRVADTVREIHGEERWAPMEHPSLGAEDFSRVIADVPGAMVFLGAHLLGREPETAPGNHSPRAAFDDAVLPDGAALYAQLALGHLTTTD